MREVRTLRALPSLAPPSVALRGHAGPVSRRRYYAVRYLARYGTYTMLGKSVMVRTFASEAERDAWVADQAPTTSILFDGRREAVAAFSSVTERGNGTMVPIAEAVPGLA
jgi:hypothetical protein